MRLHEKERYTEGGDTIDGDNEVANANGISPIARRG